MDDQERIRAGLERDVRWLNSVIIGLIDFANEILTDVAHGEKIDDTMLSNIKTRCLANVDALNSPVLTVDQQADITRTTKDHLGKIIDAAIVKFRQNKMI